jgi:hypothetical protein
VIADAPGTGSSIKNLFPDPNAIVDIDYKWHFLIAARSKTEKRNVAYFGHDVSIKGTIVEGQFLDTVAGGAGTNSATKRMEWVVP